MFFFFILFSIELKKKKTHISIAQIAPIFHFETQTMFHICNLLYVSQCSSVHCDYFSTLFIENLHIYFLVHLYEHLHDPSKENFAGFAVFVCEHCSNFGSFFYLCFNFNLTAVDIQEEAGRTIHHHLDASMSQMNCPNCQRTFLIHPLFSLRPLLYTIKW